METCHRCQAFLQPEWDRCKICGAARPEPAPVGAPPPPAPTLGGRSARRSPKDADFPIVPVVAGVGVVLLVLVVGVLALTSGGEVERTLAGAESSGFGAAETRAWCDGKDGTNPNAPAYEPTPGYHGIEIWQPAATEVGIIPYPPEDPMWNTEPELVGCLQMVGSTFVQDCPGYDGGRTVKAHDATYELTVLAVRDGAEVHRTTLSGSSTCPMSEWFVGNASTADYYGPPRRVDEAVAPFVAIPDATGVVPTTAPPPQPVPTDPTCAPGPFVLSTTYQDGTPRELVLPYAWIVTFEHQPKTFVFASDFPVDPTVLRTSNPPTPEGGTSVTIGFDLAGEPAYGKVTLKPGTVVVGSRRASGPQYSSISIRPREESPTGVSLPEADVLPTSVGADFTCLDLIPRERSNHVITGRISAEVVAADESVYR